MLDIYSMRWTRPLLLIAILLIIWGVGTTYYARLRLQNAAAPNKPLDLPSGTNSLAEGWSYSQNDGDKPVVLVRAKDYRDVNNQFELTGVELHLFQKKATEFDLVKSEKAAFDFNKKLLFSDGEVEITMGVPAGEEEPPANLMKIKSSGVYFETKTGKATTGRAASFKFDAGYGRAVGASYDPQIHELHLQSQIFLVWTGRERGVKPMQVEAGDLTYKEKESKVYLGGWSKLKRDTLTLSAGPAVVTIANKLIKEVDTEHVVGEDLRPNRKVDYAADKLTMNFDDDGQIKKIVGEQNARLVSHGATADTTVTSDRIDLDFDTASGDSVLQSALATGHSTAESKPVLKQGVEPADTRILRSDVIKIAMKPDGQQIDSVETASAGAMEFIPNSPGKPHRWVNGDHIWIKYGEKNQIDWLHTINAATKTLKPRTKDAKQDPPLALTWSKEMRAEFDPKTAQLSKLEQWSDFRYEEGDRKAKAERALLEQGKNLIHLTGLARVWDSTGSTDADRILLDQQSGDFSADGNVNSTRMPDKKKTGQPGGLLSEDEPMHAKARKMSSKDNNLLVRYDGNAIAWQGPDRLEADVIEIDRDNNIVKAHGHVVSQLHDKGESGKKEDKPATANTDKKDSQTADKKAPAKSDDKAAKTEAKKEGASPAKAKDPNAAPIFTIVKAPEMLYKDDDKLATYTGGVTLERPNMKVKSSELRAYLRDADESNSSSLDKAFADGKVEIVQTSPLRTRTGTSEHAEYYVDENKVILEKGHPLLLDSKKGSTRGKKLTWYSDDDRLVVDGADDDPVKSRLKRKSH